MKKLVTLCSKNEPGAVEVAGGVDRFIVEKEYSDEDFAVIRQQADKYEIYIYSSWGSDYGYGQSSSSESESTRCIEDYQIVVSDKNANFVGVIDTSDYYSFNKEGRTDKSTRVVLINDRVDNFRPYPLIKKSGSSFSSDDHERWDYSYYYLKKVSDALPTPAQLEEDDDDWGMDIETYFSN